MFNMRAICERYIDALIEVYACFIDYEKAFYRVSHEIINICLQQMGMKGNDLIFIISFTGHRMAVLEWKRY